MGTAVDEALAAILRRPAKRQETTATATARLTSPPLVSRAHIQSKRNPDRKKETALSKIPLSSSKVVVAIMKNLPLRRRTSFFVKVNTEMNPSQGKNPSARVLTPPSFQNPVPLLVLSLTR